MADNTTYDVVLLISQYLEPSPFVYTRLAAVNTAFYSVFTSDKLWAPFDVYGKGTGIFEHFTQSIHGLGTDAAYSWQESKQAPGSSLVPQLHNHSNDPASTENRYVQLGLCLNHCATPPSHDRGFLAFLLEKHPHMFYRCPADVRNDVELAYIACSADGDNIQYCTHPLCNSKGFLKRVVDAPISCLTLGTAGYVYALDAELEQYILENRKDLISYLILGYPGFESDRATEMVRTLSRQDFLEVFRGKPALLDSIKVKSNDYELYKAVLELQEPCNTYREMRFLLECHDQEVISLALQNYPASIFWVPEEYRRNKETLLRCITLCDPPAKGPVNWFDPNRMSADPFGDPDIITLMFRKRFAGLNNYKGYPAPAALSILADTDEWVRDQIRIDPNLWNMASPRLQQDKQILTLAYETDKTLYSMHSMGLYDSYTPFSISRSQLHSTGNT